MIYLDLYLTFLKIGLTSFGGLSMVPLINKEMISHRWMTAQEVTDIVAIAESTPGPLGINCATFAGVKAAGIFGGLVASLGALTPSLTIGILAGYFFMQMKNTSLVQRTLSGIRPACIAMIVFTLVSLLPSTYLIDGHLNYSCPLISLIIAFCIYQWKLSVPKCIGLAAVLGLVLI